MHRHAATRGDGADRQKHYRARVAPDLSFYDSDSTVPMDDFDTDEASDLEADSDASTIPWSDLIGLPSGTDDDADP